MSLTRSRGGYVWYDGDLERICKKLTIPGKYMKHDLADLEPAYEQQAEAIEVARNFVKDFNINREQREEVGEGHGIVFFGPPGSGKSMLGALIAKAVTEKGFPAARGKFLPHWRYLKLTTTFEDSPDGEEARDLLHRCREGYDVLVLDDVGREYSSGSGWSEVEFNAVIRMRYDQGLPTIITSNYGPDKWVERYGDAAASFMREGFTTVPVAGADVRRSLRT